MQCTSDIIQSTHTITYILFNLYNYKASSRTKGEKEAEAVRHALPCRNRKHTAICAFMASNAYKSSMRIFSVRVMIHLQASEMVLISDVRRHRTAGIWEPTRAPIQADAHKLRFWGLQTWENPCVCAVSLMSYKLHTWCELLKEWRVCFMWLWFKEFWVISKCSKWTETPFIKYESFKVTFIVVQLIFAGKIPSFQLESVQLGIIAWRRKISQQKLRNNLKLVTQISCTDQQKAA